MTFGALGETVIRVKWQYDRTGAQAVRRDVQGLTGFVARAGQASSLLASRFRNAFLVLSAGAVGAAVSFAKVEKATVGLSRVTGLSGNAMGRLAAEVKGLGRSLGLTEQQALDLATTASRLGIQGQDLVLFIKTAQEASVALGIDVNSVSETMAKLRANLVLSVSDLNKLTGAIFALDNVSAASFPEILAAMSRVGPLARIMGVSGQQLAALSAAIVETGTSAETAGTALSQILQSLLRRSEQLAPLLGTTGSELRAFAAKSPVEAILRLAQTFTALNSRGEDTSEFLRAIGLDGRRTTAVLAVLGSQTDRFNELLRVSNGEFAKGSALARAFGLQTGTLAFQWQLLKASFFAAAAEIGKRLGPAIEGLFRILRSMFEAIRRSPMLQFAAAFTIIGGAVAAAAGFLVFFAASQFIAFKVASTAIPAMINWYKGLTSAAGAAAVAQTAAQASGGILNPRGGILGFGRVGRASFISRLKKTTFRSQYLSAGVNELGTAESTFRRVGSATGVMPAVTGLGRIAAILRVIGSIAARAFLPFTIVLGIVEALRGNLFGVRDDLKEVFEPWKKVFGEEGKKGLGGIVDLLKVLARALGYVIALGLKPMLAMFKVISTAIAYIVRGVLWLLDKLKFLRPVGRLMGLDFASRGGGGAGGPEFTSPRLVQVQPGNGTGQSVSGPTSITLNNPQFLGQSQVSQTERMIDRALLRHAARGASV